MSMLQSGKEKTQAVYEDPEIVQDISTEIRKIQSETIRRKFCAGDTRKKVLDLVAVQATMHISFQN